MKKLYAMLEILLIAVIALTSCGSAATTTTTTSTTPSGTTTSTTPTPTPTTQSPKYGGTLRIIYPYSPATIPGWPGDTTNPQKLWLSWIVFEALVKLHRRQCGDPCQPALHGQGRRHR
jgi:hypothetical protein